jgi:hypothetical protein
MCQDAFMDKNKAEATALASMAVDKHTYKMAEYAHMAELKIKKQQMDIKANEKFLKAENRQIATQHQYKCKKEQHDMQMLYLYLQYQRGSSITRCAAPAAQFGPGMEGFVNQSAFGDMGTGIDGNYLM